MGPASDLCTGPSQGGGFGECCDRDSQCTAGMVCDPDQRACTFNCTSVTDCYAAPLHSKPSCGLLNRMTCDYVDYVYPVLWGAANRSLGSSDGAPTQQYCDASTGYGWSFTAYCKSCKSGNWSGDAGPDVGYSDAQRVGTLLGSLLEDLCATSPAIQQRCTNSTVKATLDSFILQVQNTCAQSPSGASLCTFGLSVDSLFDAALLLLGLGDWEELAAELTPAERVDVALNLVISVRPKSTFGVSLPTSEVVMASKWVHSPHAHAHTYTHVHTRRCAPAHALCSGCPPPILSRVPAAREWRGEGGTRGSFGCH